MMEFITNYLNNLFALTNNTQVTGRNKNKIDLFDGFDKISGLLKNVKDNEKKIMLVGNGGSASIANHFQTDLSNCFIRAITFYESSMLTAFSNDYGYNFAFERFVNLWAEPDDLLIGISSSGHSDNILRAAQAAHKKDCSVFTISGFQEDNPLRSIGDLNFYISSSHYGFVETAHSILVHCITDYYNINYSGVKSE